MTKKPTPLPPPRQSKTCNADAGARCWFGYYFTFPKDAAKLRQTMADRRRQLAQG